MWKIRWGERQNGKKPTQICSRFETVSICGIYCTYHIKLTCRWAMAKDIDVSGRQLILTLDIQRFWANAQCLPMPSQVSKQKKKPSHVQNTQAYLNPIYTSRNNIRESRSSEQGTLVQPLQREKRGDVPEVRAWWTRPTLSALLRSVHNMGLKKQRQHWDLLKLHITCCWWPSHLQWQQGGFFSRLVKRERWCKTLAT